VLLTTPQNEVYAAVDCEENVAVLKTTPLGPPAHMEQTPEGPLAVAICVMHWVWGTAEPCEEPLPESFDELLELVVSMVKLAQELPLRFPFTLLV
jgi:hypothetical protein